MSQKPEPAALKVGDMARQAGVGVQTLHYYERLGLLPKPRRSSANYRLYSRDALRRVQFIKKAQKVGFTLEEVRQILGFQKQGARRCRGVAELGEERLREIDEQLEILRAFRRSLAAALLKWKAESARRHNCAGEFCDLIENLPGESIGPDDLAGALSKGYNTQPVGGLRRDGIHDRRALR